MCLTLINAMVSSEHYFLLTAWLPSKEQHQNPTKNIPLIMEWQLREATNTPGILGTFGRLQGQPEDMSLVWIYQI